MPRSQSKTEPDIPLFLIPHVIQRQIRLYGENVERVVVRNSVSHFYNISIRTRAIKRELFGRRAETRDQAAVPAGNDGGDA